MRFGDFVEINPTVKLTKGGTYPFVEMGVVEPGNRYVRAGEERMFMNGGAKFQTGDTLFARITPCLENGKIAQFKAPDNTCGFGSTEFFVFRAKDGISDPGYVYYLSLTDQIRKPAEKSMSGASGRQRADLKAIKELEVSAPSLETQCKVASVLSAYDDLIENNARRIAILEEMAQALYREWFVHFRFPGHEEVPLVEVEGMQIPKGWEVRPFSEIADVLSGGTPKTEMPEYWNGEIPFFSPKDHNGSFFISRTERYVTELGLSKCNSRLYPPNTVFITARGTVGKVIMPSVPMAMNQSCYALHGRHGVHQYFIFLSIMGHIEQLKQRAHGAVFDTIIVDTFSKLETRKPPADVLNKFVEVVSPAFDLIRNLLDKNMNLRQTRDLLLPRLISGELDVSHIPRRDVALQRLYHLSDA